MLFGIPLFHERIETEFSGMEKANYSIQAQNVGCQTNILWMQTRQKEIVCLLTARKRMTIQDFVAQL